MRTLQRNGYQVSPDTTVDGWLDAHQVPSRQRRLLWEPLCVAALNTVSNIASAQMLANVLRDSLGGPRAASDLLLPKVSLSALFPQPAANFIQARGNTVRHGQRVDSIRKTDDGWRLGSGEIYQHVIVATAPYHVAGILGDHAPDLAQMEWEPIVTSYLQYPPSFRLPQAMLGLVDGHAQWLFDRGQLCGQKGLVAAVISARGRHLQLETTELEARIAAEICRVAGDDAKPVGSITITEKRATFSATPGLRRPVHKLCRGLWLAGDAVAGDYPATLEGAVRAGISVADGILSGG
jgi:squalene-associated FAD-dependent desaturase